MNFGSWPSHGRGHPSDPLPRPELKPPRLTLRQETNTDNKPTQKLEETITNNVVLEKETTQSVETPIPTPENSLKTITHLHEDQCESDPDESESETDSFHSCEADSFHSCNDSLPELNLNLLTKSQR